MSSLLLITNHLTLLSTRTLRKYSEYNYNTPVSPPVTCAKHCSENFDQCMLQKEAYKIAPASS